MRCGATHTYTSTWQIYVNRRDLQWQSVSYSWDGSYSWEPWHPTGAVDGDYTVGWSSSQNPNGPCSKDWLQIRLRKQDESVFTRSVKIHFNPDKLPGLIGAEIRVGNNPGWSSIYESSLCATVPMNPNIKNESDDHAFFELDCSDHGTFIYLLQPNAVCIEILEFEVVGRRHGCTNCARGTYEDETGSTACKHCSWAWAHEATFTTVSNEISLRDDATDCQCPAGATGTAGGFFQDVQGYRPTYRGTYGNFTIVFNQSSHQFLHGPLITSGSTDEIYNRPNDDNLHRPQTFNVSSNGGLTIVAKVKFSGEIGHSEKILDFGNARESEADSISLGRFQASSRLFALIAEGDSRACEIIGPNASIVQDEWMTVTFQYDAMSNEMSLSKNGQIIAGPASCASVPMDRAVTRMFIGKSNHAADAFFNGEIMSLYVAAQTLRNLSDSCSLHQSSSASTCSDALQSSTQTSAMKAVDRNMESCSQTWRETSPWWRLDLQMSQLVTSVRVHGRVDCCQEDLDGFDVRVGNYPKWEHNPICTSSNAAPTDSNFVDVVCQAEGRYVFIVLTGANRTLALCEVQVIGLGDAAAVAISGLLPNCTTCPAGLLCVKHGIGLAGVLICVECFAQICVIV